MATDVPSLWQHELVTEDDRKQILESVPRRRSRNRGSRYMNRKILSIYKLYRIVDTVDTELAGEAYQRYLDREANAAKIAELENGHRHNSHSE